VLHGTVIEIVIMVTILFVTFRVSFPKDFRFTDGLKTGVKKYRSFSFSDSTFLFVRQIYMPPEFANTHQGNLYLDRQGRFFKMKRCVFSQR
jgi:hypothetical protein